MNKQPLFVFLLNISWKEMDMSGGDSIDGPRWTGKYIDVSNTFLAVAPNETFAREAMKQNFYEHEKPHIVSCENVGPVRVFVTTATDRL